MKPCPPIPDHREGLPARMLLLLAVAGLAACGGGAASPDRPDAADGPADISGDTAGEVPADVPADVLADVPEDPSADLPADTPADLPGDAPADLPPDVPPDAPPPGNLALLDFESPVALTPDGRTALVWTLADGRFALYDTATGALDVQASLGSPQRNMPAAMSATLRVAALQGEPVRAALWTKEGGWIDLGSLFETGCVQDPGPPVTADLGGAFDVSDDGHVAVGLSWDGCARVQAFRWSDASGTGVLSPLAVLGKVADGSSQPAPNNRASVVSGDGRIAAGFAQNGAVDRSPAIWNEDGTGFLLDPADETNPGEIKALNHDGSIAAGDWSGKGFTWTAAGGVTKFAASDPPSDFDTVLVNAMTDDGAAVFGTVVTFDPDLLSTSQKACVWTAATGVRYLGDVAAAQGISLLPTQTFTNVLSVSADGTVVLGTVLDTPTDPMAFPTQASFVLRLPQGAYAPASGT